MIENFEQLEFNRKVDVLVAMHVMEWKDIVINEVTWGPGTTKWMCKGTDRSGGIGYIPLYSTLLSSAWDMVRKFEYLYLYHNKKFVKGNGWYCSLVVGEENYMYADTEMLVICYAALKAVGFDVKLFLKEEGKV